MTQIADQSGAVGERAALSRKALYERVWDEPLASVAAELGITRNGLAKICDRLMIPYPGRNYWAKPADVRTAMRPPLPAPTSEMEEQVVIAAGRAPSRRTRTRLSPEARREQLIDAAARIIASEGLHSATMKRVAREVGLSEAQAHNCFSKRTDLLVALARRELAGMNAVRQSEIARAHDNQTRVTLSTLYYLRQVAERGALIQVLSNSPEVRAGLRAERRTQTALSRRLMTERLNTRYGVDGDLAYGATVILTAICLRAGRLLAERKIPLDMAERLSLAMVTAGNRTLVAQSRAARAGTA